MPKKRKHRPSTPLGRALPWLLFAVVLAGSVLTVYVAYLDHVITARFEGRRWALPAQVYARPLEIFEGQRLTPDELTAELERLGYRRGRSVAGTGTFARSGSRIEIHVRPFTFWDGLQPARRATVIIRDGKVRRLTSGDAGMPLLRLDPQLIGSIYPEHGEDRILVRLDQVPETLLAGLIVVEDRRFPEHPGIDPIAIGRAALANLRAMALVQGGSTLTQQLVKNYFLTNSRTLWRKFNEAIMAMLLEWHYRKPEILEAYLNEVYLGQDGPRAIHGFGLASRYYFQKPLSELQLHEQALLVALVKGPSYYHPIRHPERAKRRRDLVLSLMAEAGAVDAAGVQAAQRRPLGVAQSLTIRRTRYPAFIDLVREQLRQDYRSEDLSSEGLRIFTTLDPRVQARAEQALEKGVEQIERERDLSAIQGAVVVTDVNTAEVLALVGSRRPGDSAFNRALNASRPVGSLIKPFVYLAALEQSPRYDLATLLEDSPLAVEMDNGRTWSPSNYDDRYHGDVPMFEALAQSYNAATVRLGLSVGVARVIDTLKRAGLDGEPAPFPSLLLGAVSRSPLAMAQIYQTLASGGFFSPLRAIREVVAQDGQQLQRYPIEMGQAFSPKLAYLMTRALQLVASRGTAAKAGDALAGLDVAGKTGTTDDYRDSWFAGFTGSHSAVVWLGRDDNEPLGLTGATGALPVWIDLVRRIGGQALNPVPPPGVESRWIDAENGLLADRRCENAAEVPFIEGTAPRKRSPCLRGGRPLEWLRQWLN